MGLVPPNIMNRHVFSLSLSAVYQLCRRLLILFALKSMVELEFSRGRNGITAYCKTYGHNYTQELGEHYCSFKKILTEAVPRDMVQESPG